MKKQHNLLGAFLAAVVGLAFLAAILCRALLPHLILPRWDAPTMITLVLVALVLHHYLTKHAKQNYLLLLLYGALIYGLFPLASGFVSPMDALWSAILGAIVTTVITFLYDTMVDRLSTSPASKLAPLISAGVLFLAIQSLAGII